MPFLDAPTPAGLSPQTEAPLETTGHAPPFGRVLDAAMKRDNTVGAVVGGVMETGPSAFDPNYDPFQNVTGYEDYASAFADANSDADVSRIKARIDGERRRTEMLDAAGGWGLLAEVIAGVADPVNLVPVGGEAVAISRTGTRFLEGALRVGRAGLVSTAVQEGVLQSVQDTRTLTESAINISAATLLSGVLGGGVAAYAGRDLNAVARGAMADAENIAKGMDANLGGGGGEGGSLSAAAARSTNINDETLASTLGVAETLARTSPTLRMATSPNIATRQLGQELAEQPLQTKGNQAGTASPIAAESLIRQYQYPLAKALTEADDMFVQYRLGRAKKFGDTLKLGFADTLGKTPAGMLTREQFMEEVGKAMRRGDQSSIPEVAQAAKSLRENVFEPLKKKAIDLELLPENVDPKTAESYLMRLYNHQKIVAERNQFSDIITNWYADEQVKKAGVQSRVRDLHTEMADLEARIKDAEDKIAGRESTRDKMAARQEEVRRVREFALKRSMAMSEPIDELHKRIEGLQAQMGPQLARLEELRAQISAEKDKFPHIREADATIFKLIGAGQKIAQSKEIVDTVDALEEFSKELAGVRGAFQRGTRDAADTAKAARLDTPGAEQLVALEKTRSAIGKEIKPFIKALRQARKDYVKLRKQRVPRAQGGAVFETRAIKRGNSLADQIMGRDAALEDLSTKMEQHEARLKEVQKELEDAVSSWEGNTSKTAKSAVARRNTADAERRFLAEITGGAEPGRLAAADKPVIKAAKAILKAETNLSRADLQDVARQTIDRILSTPAGRLPYDVHTPAPESHGKNAAPDARGPLKARVFMIPDHLIEKYLESDATQIARAYTRTMAPDVVLGERGWLDFAEKIKPITERYETLRKGVTDPKKMKALQDRMDQDIGDIKAVYERLRGTYKLPDDPMGLTTRTFRVVRDLNYMRLMGGMTVSALPDVARTVMTHGLMPVVRDGLVPMIKNFKEYRLASGEVKMAGEALDMVLDSRAMNIADVMDDFGRYSKFERGITAASAKFGVVSLMAPWNAAMKQFVGVVSQTRSLKAIDALMAGNIGVKERARLAQFGIDDDLAKRIHAEVQVHGRKTGELRWANTDAWTDRGAVEAYRAALSNEVNVAIVTPGQEKPLFMSTEAGRIFGQFRSFNMSSMQRVAMTGLQKRDADTLSGAVLMTGLGAMAYYLKTDKERLSDDPKVWLREGIDRAGLTGWMFDVNNMVEKVTRGQVGLSKLMGGPTMSRYASRNFIESVLGPTVGLAEDTKDVIGAAATGEWTEGDTRRIRKMLPFQNLIGLRHLFDAAEEGINRATGR